jgi:hypothetical protein
MRYPSDAASNYLASSRDREADWQLGNEEVRRLVGADLSRHDLLLPAPSFRADGGSFAFPPNRHE